MPFGPTPGDALSGLWPAPRSAAASGAPLCLSDALQIDIKTTLSQLAEERQCNYGECVPASSCTIGTWGSWSACSLT